MLVDKYLPALRKRRTAGLAVSVLLVATAFALRALTPINLSFATFYPAVLLSTFVGGRWIGLLATGVSAILAWYFFVTPIYSFELSFQNTVNLLAFIIVGLILVITGDALATALERSERNRNRHEELLREMSHRLKNQYAVLAAVARGVSKDANTLQDFDLLFAEKMRGLASSHDLLVSGHWQGATLEEVVHAHLKPFCQRHQYTVDGKRVVLDAARVQYLGMAFHELSTNALKHGALKDPGGIIKISWTEADRNLHLKWTEHASGGAGRRGEVQGFGSKVLEFIVPAAVNGDATLEYLPAGLQWSISVPMSTQDNQPPVNKAVNA